MTRYDHIDPAEGSIVREYPTATDDEVTQAVSALDYQLLADCGVRRTAGDQLQHVALTGSEHPEPSADGCVDERLSRHPIDHPPGHRG